MSPGFKPSSRSSVDRFMAMDVLRQAVAMEAAGQRIVHMEVGQPGAPAPAAVIEAARRALDHGRFTYTEALGRLPLRLRIAEHYCEEYGIEVPPERIAVTTGSSAGFNLAFLSAFDAGDRIALAAPGYPAYRNLLHALGIEVVNIQTSAESGYVMTPEMLAAAHDEKPLAGVLVASPANPTGTVMQPDALKALVETAEARGIRFISDEIYHRLVYAGRAETALRYSEDAIVINSFSKYYCMTGWRIGWMVIPDDLVAAIEGLSGNLYISAPDISQQAAIAAFDAKDDLDVVKAGYEKSRSLLLERLPAIGFDEFFPVDGAFYIYASVRRFSNDSADFARRMLAEAGVAATPGADFDKRDGSAWLRFSFAGTPEQMAEAAERLEGWLR